MTDYSIADYVIRWTEVERESAKLSGLSLADELGICESFEPGTTETLLEELGADALDLAYAWDFWGREKQQAITESTSRITFVVGGRGSGKTRPAVEWVIWRLMNGAREIALVGPTYDEIKQFMLGGVKKPIDGAQGSGLFDVLPPWIEHHYKEDEGTIDFPQFKALIRLHSAEVAEYRGPAPDSVWGDELSKWRYPEKLLSNLSLACRDVGILTPQLMFTANPKKVKFLRDLVMDPRVVTITCEMGENTGNIDPEYVRSETARLGGTAQGAEEIFGKLGVEEEGSIFKLTAIDKHRVEVVPALDWTVVAVDPAGSAKRNSDDTGIIAMGRAGDIQTGHGYVLGDKTGRYSWDDWGVAAFELLERVGASAFVLERNHFADAVANLIRTIGAARGYRAEPRTGIKDQIDLVHKQHGRIQLIEVLAKKDKVSRARPVATLYEKGRLHHHGRGELVDTEVEMTEWDPTSGFSPGRVDALVHAATILFQLDRAPEYNPREQVAGLPDANKRLNELAGRSRTQWRTVGQNRGRTV